MSKFLEMLESCKDNLKDSNYDINTLMSNLDVYESAVSEFFSKTCEAENIRNMYSDLKNINNDSKSIMCIALNESADIYNEYLEGMINFINDIKDIEVTESEDSLTSFTEKFNKAKENDSLFIESLFTGKLTKEKEMFLTEAVSNVEFSIDFICSIKDFKDKCKTLQESFIEEDSTKTKLLNNCRDMLFESVNNYCYSTLKNVNAIYESINDTLYDRNKTIKTEGFKLF